jgi:DHA1 family bicyclomycin/chloramphenicol resistance-like MFS transporter
MTTTAGDAGAATTAAVHRRQFVPGTKPFTATLAVAMGLTALSIDSVLPAFDDIRAEFGLASDASDVAALVTAFIVGMGIGTLPAGLLADRYGRRPVLCGGIAVFVAGAVIAAVAPSLGVMIAARFVWGLGASGPRVVVTAMLRDVFAGERMARELSSIMAVFLLVPMFAPAIGAGLIAVGPWQLTIWLCVVVAMLLLLASTRLPETMAPGARRRLSLRDVWAGWRIVLSTPGTIGYLVALTATMATFLSFIASSENIVDEVFGLGDWFALIFGALGAGMAVANLANGRFVEALGLRRLLRLVPLVQVGTAALLALITVLGEGRPPFGVFAVVLLVVLITQQVTMVNINAAAMTPLGHVAGSGAALLTMVPTVVGALLGSIVDRSFDGTVTPLALAILASALVTVAATRWAVWSSRRLPVVATRN